MSMAATRTDRHLVGRGAGVLVALLPALGALAVGQDLPASAPASATSPATGTLFERQKAVSDRLSRLENRMLQLARRLAESAPEKVERLHGALEHVGRRELRRRAEQVAALLRAGRLSAAEREQESLLTDLEALLELLASRANELDRRRAERERLESFRRAIRHLMDGQTENLHRLQTMGNASADGSEAGAAELRELERLQRRTQNEAVELRARMQRQDGELPAPPGVPQVGEAAEAMRNAGDRIGERQLDRAQQQQRAALEQLQRALNELDDALRQVRREEQEETLAALAVRFGRMLAQERSVQEIVMRMPAPGVAGYGPAERQELAGAADTQRAVTQECAATLRILVDEGTTVIMPELVRQLAADMGAAAERLARADASDALRALLDDIIGLLEEIVRAIEVQRETDARAAAQGNQDPRGSAAPALLPASAELKLLRSAQIRINRRTADLAASERPDPADESAPPWQRLSARQRRLAELARRMGARR